MKTYEELNYTDRSLKIQFNITMGVEGAFANGSITIYGLSNNDMEYLASCYDPMRGIFKSNFVSLEAGYVGVLGLLLRGNILEIDSNFNEQGNAVTLKVMAGAGNNLAKNNVSTSLANKVAFKTIAEQCAKKQRFNA